MSKNKFKDKAAHAQNKKAAERAILRRKYERLRRRVQVFTRERTSLLLGTAILALMGGILLSQMLKINRTEAQTADISARINEYQNQIDQEQRRYASLYDEKQQLNQDRTALINSYLEANPILGGSEGDFLAELNFNRVMAGGTPVTGSGVSLHLSDPVGIDYGTATAADIIHEQDVMGAVNLLKANGAVAMAVNGERLTATSKLICNGPTILVNRSLLSAPFVITAVGDADSMLSAIQSDSNITRLVATGKDVRISRLDELTIPAFSDQYIFAEALSMMKEVLANEK